MSPEKEPLWSLWVDPHTNKPRTGPHPYVTGGGQCSQSLRVSRQVLGQGAQCLKVHGYTFGVRLVNSFF